MFHYDICGIDNVWLANGYTTKETRYGEATAFADVGELDELIALTVTQKAGKLTGRELRMLRVALKMPQSALAHAFGATEQSVSLWERNGKVPKYADLLVRALVIDKLRGPSKLSRIIARIDNAEGIGPQRIIAKMSGKKWSAELVAESDALAA